MIFPSRTTALAKSIALEPLDLLARLLPARLAAPQDARGAAPWILLAHGGLRGLSEKLSREGVESIGFSSAQASSHPELSRTIADAYLACKRIQSDLGSEWKPGPDWGPLLDAGWAPVRRSMASGDLDSVDAFFRSMFRNEAIAGLWGGSGMFDNFRHIDRWWMAGRASQFLHQLRRWKEGWGGDVGRLAAAEVGEPWGWLVEGHLVVEPTLEYDAHARDILRIIDGVSNPIVLEIGGGYGGMARQLLRDRSDLAYIGVDLPENACLQAYYLTHALPDRDVHLHHQQVPQRVEPGSIHLMPNFALRNLPAGSATIVVNFRSFAEIHAAGLDALFREIARIQPRWLFQENLGERRLDGLAGIPLGDLPRLEGYRTLTEHPSPWLRYGEGSPYPCRVRLQERISTP
ncbi:MAG: putative sugar O-methyltransferase [Fibrobacterota bacterium]|nr:putative sugar O-methyltransferase [Fibrobacterota bacterium]QQS06562.1 MAG: putative sugar O-methyltransferase [Fibrobacterota bacterium]